MSMRRRRAKASDEDLSEGEESVPQAVHSGESDADSNYSEDEYYSDEEYEEEEEIYEDNAADSNEPHDEVVASQSVVKQEQLDVSASKGAESVPGGFAPGNDSELTEQGTEEVQGSAEGQEEKQEEKQDPSRVPTAGRFFMHDDRAAAGRRGIRPGVKKLWEEKDEGLWVHDKFESLDLDEHPPMYGRGIGRGKQRGRGRGRGKFVGAPHTSTSQNITQDAQVQATSPVQLEQRPTGPGRGRGRRNSYNSYVQDGASATVGFKKFSETQDFVPKTASNGIKPHKRYSSQRESANKAGNPSSVPNKPDIYDQPVTSGGEFIPRTQPVVYAPQYTSAPYGVYPPQFQYPTYTYTGYIDPQSVPFSPVQYMPYYMPTGLPDHQPYGRGRAQFAPDTGKIWVPKNSRAIPITHPSDAQPRVSKAIPITDPNVPKIPESTNTPDSAATTASNS